MPFEFKNTQFGEPFVLNFCSRSDENSDRADRCVRHGRCLRFRSVAALQIILFAFRGALWYRTSCVQIVKLPAGKESDYNTRRTWRVQTVMQTRRVAVHDGRNDRGRRRLCIEIPIVRVWCALAVVGCTRKQTRISYSLLPRLTMFAVRYAIGWETDFVYSIYITYVDVVITFATHTTRLVSTIFIRSHRVFQPS